MHKVWWSFAAALLVALGAAGQGGPSMTKPMPSLERFVSREYNFSVMMPGKPSVETKTITSAKTGRPIHLTTFMGDLGARAYLVMISEYETTNISTDNALDGILSTFKQPRVLSRREATFFGHAGRILDVSIQGDLRMRCHVFATGTKLYQVAVIAKRDEFESAEPEFFLNSFYLYQ
jgi:hypothetical protein